jgi:hypothetical protein
MDCMVSRTVQEERELDKILDKAYGQVFTKTYPECEICGTSGSDVKKHRGTKMRICSECREAWKDYKGF